jgi:hypothetical protein
VRPFASERGRFNGQASIPLPARLLAFLPVIAVGPLWVLGVARGSAGPPGWLVILIAGLAALNVGLNAWFGVDLTPTGVVVNNLRHRRRLPWASIRAVTVEPFAGGSRVVIWTNDGRRVPLRYPLIDFTGIGRKQFEQGYHTIGQWWLYFHGPAK